MRPPRSGRGTSLIEALVALALLAVALLAGLALFAQQQRIEQRLAAARSAERSLAAVLEAARAGALPLTSGPLGADPFALPGAPRTALWLEVENEATPGLYRLRAIAAYAVGGQGFRRVVETQVWRP